MLQESVIDSKTSADIAPDVLKTAELVNATAILLMAFSSDPVARWTYPSVSMLRMPR